MRWILLAISVASLAAFIWAAVNYQRKKAEADREWHG